MTAKELLASQHTPVLVSELIAQLEKLKADRGDLPVIVEYEDADDGPVSFYADAELAHTGRSIYPPPTPGTYKEYIRIV